MIVVLCVKQHNLKRAIVNHDNGNSLVSNIHTIPRIRDSIKKEELVMASGTETGANYDIEHKAFQLSLYTRGTVEPALKKWVGVGVKLLALISGDVNGFELNLKDVIPLISWD